MMNRTVQPQPSARGGGMTLRVYTVDPRGKIIHDRGTVTVPFTDEPLPLTLDTGYPPCACPRHRAGQAVRP